LEQLITKKQNRIGEVNYNTYGSRMQIIEYNNSLDVVVKFEDGYITTCQYDAFKKGILKNPYDKTINGVGYLSKGIYSTHDKAYQTWLNMMTRCYNEKYQEKFPTYKGCTVCDEWHNYQNFSRWFYENYYTIDGEQIDLEKDVIHKNNKIYSPETCIFAPHSINLLFIKRNAMRGNLPIGVFLQQSGKYLASCSILHRKIKRIGLFDTSEEAFAAYKEFKEQLIKDVADEYKDKIPKKLYDAMYTYEVEITD
jgi:hypothetical protein